MSECNLGGDCKDCKSCCYFPEYKWNEKTECCEVIKDE